MRDNKFIILTSLQSLNLSYLLLFHVMSTTKLFLDPPWFPAFVPWFSIFFCISNQIPCITTLIFCTRVFIPFLAFTPLFSTFPSFRSPVPYFGSYRQIAQFGFWRIWKFKNSCFKSKTHTPLFLTLATKFFFTSSMTLSVLSRKSVSTKKSITCEVWANNSEWLNVTYVSFSKVGRTCPK